MLRWCRRCWRARPCNFRAGGTSPHQLGDIIQQNILGVTVAMGSVQKSKKATITVLGTCVRCVESSTWATGRCPVTSRFLRLFFFSALIVSLLSSSFCSWLVGVFLNRHHILMLRPKTLFQHFPSHGFATPEPPAVAATSRRPPTLETQIQVTRLRKCHQYQHLTKVTWARPSFSSFALKDLEASALLDLVGPRLFQSFSMWELLVR